MDPNNIPSTSSVGALRYIKYAGFALCGAMLAGIGGLMVLARGKGEDITGIVAPALLVAIMASGVGIAAGIAQRRVEKTLRRKVENTSKSA